jgi:hypothetical protein
MKESAVVVLRHVVSAVSVVKMSFMYVTWLGQSPSAFVSFRHGQLSLQARDLHSLDCSSTRLASLSSQLEVLMVEALPEVLPDAAKAAKRVTYCNNPRRGDIAQYDRSRSGVSCKKNSQLFSFNFIGSLRQLDQFFAMRPSESI